ncbi:MAG TPA: rRNA maturation RNase YbeY, partial [Polyangiaceae bacterium]
MTTFVRRTAPASPPISRRIVRMWGDAMLMRLGRYEAELSVLLTDDATIRKLNRDYRQKDRPTDVLSFHFDAQPQSTGHAECLLGDIVVSLDTAQRQAKGRKRSLEDEVRWLLAHGLLHLCGFDHGNVEQKRVMVAWTRRLVRAAQSSLPSASVRLSTKVPPSPPRTRKPSETVPLRGARPRRAVAQVAAGR